MLKERSKWLVPLILFVGYGIFATGVAYLPYFSLITLIVGWAVSLAGAIAVALPPTRWSEWLVRDVPSLLILIFGMRYLEARHSGAIVWLVLPIVVVTAAAALPLVIGRGKDQVLLQKLRGFVGPALLLTIFGGIVLISLTRSGGWPAYFLGLGLELISFAAIMTFFFTIRMLYAEPEREDDLEGKNEHARDSAE